MNDDDRHLLDDESEKNDNNNNSNKKINAQPELISENEDLQESEKINLTSSNHQLPEVAKKIANTNERGSPNESFAPARSEKLSASSSSSYNLDELCFLSNGGSSLTLTVNEATPVGSIVGTIEVSLHLNDPPILYHPYLD